LVLLFDTEDGGKNTPIPIIVINPKKRQRLTETRFYYIIIGYGKFSIRKTSFLRYFE